LQEFEEKMASKLRERYRSELRAETLSAARDLIKEEGYEGLTLRKLAQRIQCSPMALYTYFADKQALLTALALEGFEKLAKRQEGTSRREPLKALRKIMLDHIAFAEENPTEYRILFLSVRPLAVVKKTRQEIQENNPAFRLLFKCVQSCLVAGVLWGDAFTISTIALTAAHGAASFLITLQDFPFGSHRRYAEEVVATTLSGLQNRTIPAM
jgi:AcrR family transcriptional regulator